MHLGNRLHEAKAQAVAGGGAASVGPEEAVEDAVAVYRRDAGAVVADFEEGGVVFGGEAGEDFGCVAGVFQRVFQQVRQELLDELDEYCSFPNIVKVLNNGNDFPGVPERSADFVFSFGVFVHLDVDIIAGK